MAPLVAVNVHGYQLNARVEHRPPRDAAEQEEAQLARFPKCLVNQSTTHELKRRDDGHGHQGKQKEDGRDELPAFHPLLAHHFRVPKYARHMMPVRFPGLAGPVVEHAIRCRHENGRLLSYLADLNIFTILDVHMSIISGDKQSGPLGFRWFDLCEK